MRRESRFIASERIRTICDPSPPAHSAAAIGSMRTLSTAAEQYRLRQGSYPTTLSDLAAVDPALVDSLDEAISFVNQYGSGHSESIITSNKKRAESFLNEVDASSVYWNASTRFTDGFEFGLGAEIGISTDRLHARGPMGLEELCTYKYQIIGNGQFK